MGGGVALHAVSATELERAAREAGTPVALIDESCLKSRWDGVRRALDGVELFFPYKSCPLAAVRGRFAAWGAGADVASPEELEAALELGVRPPRILLNQPLRNRAGLKRAVEVGAVVVADGRADVGRAAELAAEGHPVRLLVRVNAGVGAPVWTRFGVPVDGPELRSALRDAKESGIDVLGLHTHLGTNIRTAAPFREMAVRIAAGWPECEGAYGAPLRYLDIGGGFATPSAQPLTRAPAAWAPDPPEVVIEQVRDALHDAGLSGRIALWAEPGRLLAEDAGVLVARIVAVRDSAAGPMVTCDAGVNLLPTAGHIRHQVICVRAVPASDVPVREFDLFGPLCMQSDVLGVGVRLPQDVREGDLLAMGPAGGYDLSFSFPFIVGRCPVLLRSAGGELRLARRRETWGDLNQLQTPL